MNVRAGRFPLFDSLRAIAALAVVTTHAAFWTGAVVGGNSALRPYLARLDVGVTIFFLISGFLLYRPFARAHLNDEKQPRTVAYAWRRVLRIVPAYWLALTVSVIWLGSSGVFTPSGIPTFYLFGQIYQTHTLAGGLNQAWTLCVEITFYAFIPVWAFALRTFRGSTPRTRLWLELGGLAFLFAGSFAGKLIVLNAQGQRPVHYTSALEILPMYLDQFAVGMTIAVLSVWWEERDELPRALRPLDRFPSLAWLFAFVAFWVVSTRIGLSGFISQQFTHTQFIEQHLLYTAVAFGLTLPAVFGDQSRGFIRRYVLGNKVLLWLGLVSYGIYLWHQTVFDQLARWHFDGSKLIHPYIGWEVAVLAITVTIAAISYYGLERPILRLKRLVPNRRGQARGEALAEPAPLTPQPVPAAGERA
ncbi:MAG TPA: acyltransferase [Thermoleophilaceae bacterium]